MIPPLYVALHEQRPVQNQEARGVLAGVKLLQHRISSGKDQTIKRLRASLRPKDKQGAVCLSRRIVRNDPYTGLRQPAQQREFNTDNADSRLRSAVQATCSWPMIY